jgi:hypothetical protein
MDYDDVAVMPRRQFISKGCSGSSFLAGSIVPVKTPHRISKREEPFEPSTFATLSARRCCAADRGCPMRMHLAFSLALAAICLVESPLALAKSAPAPETFPQIVRISYIEGDVRVSRGTQGGAPKDVDWEKAVDGLPLQGGFTLATGEGRAEIEFEDASTLYLAPNSVLIFNDLESTGNVLHTELALLTGTVTLENHPDIPGATFILRTPTDTLAMQHGQKSNVRVTSYMDTLAVTPLEGGFIQASAATALVVPANRTLYYRNGEHIDYTPPPPGDNFAPWDHWVADRMSQRKATMAALLKQTGLKKPVPGLAQLAGQGKFVDCPGYGTCWQPPAPVAPAQAAPQGQPAPYLAAVPTGADTHPILYSSADTGSPAVAYSGSEAQRSAALFSPGGYGGFDDIAMGFPCGPESAYYRMAMLSGMGFMNVGLMNGYGSLGYGGLGYGSPMGLSPMGVSWFGANPWAWSVCHSGSWIYNQNRYMWVPGTTIQHNLPIRWLRSGNSIGFVPINPGDVNGKLPVNREHGVFTLGGKNGIQRIAVNPGSEIKLLNAAPKEFRKPVSASLARADAPRMQGRQLQAGINSTAHGTSAGIPITFDHRSQNFMISRQIEHGSNVRTVSEPVGSFLARSGGSFGGRAAFQDEGGISRTEGGAAGFRGGEVNAGAGANPRFSPSSSGGSQGGHASSGGSFSGGGGFTPASGGSAGVAGGAPVSGATHR